MKPYFDQDGHLTGRAFDDLLHGEPDELARLEIAEHLAYCDRCLQRYTELLDQAPLLCPARSCKESLWRQVRKRTIRLLTSRYATAAAAVALALTVLWGGVSLPVGEQRPLLEAGTAASQHLHRWPQQWNQSIGSVLSRFNDFFDQFDDAASRSVQGGNS